MIAAGKTEEGKTEALTKALRSRRTNAKWIKSADIHLSVFFSFLLHIFLYLSLSFTFSLSLPLARTHTIARCLYYLWIFGIHSKNSPRVDKCKSVLSIVATKSFHIKADATRANHTARIYNHACLYRVLRNHVYVCVEVITTATTMTVH